jgi:5-methylcytosine-specific restriction endonuclease McrA
MNRQTTCQTCDHKYTPAPSKRAGRCPNCEHIARKGISIEGARAKKAKEYQQKMRERQAAKQPKPKTGYKIPKLSESGKKRLSSFEAMAAKIKKQIFDGKGHAECEGCAQYFASLDSSHKVPRSQSLALYDNPENIRLLCRDCHNKWEHGAVLQMIELRCFDQDMKYLFENDVERFWKIFFRMLDENNERPNGKLGRIIFRLEKLG